MNARNVKLIYIHYQFCEMYEKYHDSTIRKWIIRNFNFRENIYNDQRNVDRLIFISGEYSYEVEI